MLVLVSISACSERQLKPAYINDQVYDNYPSGSAIALLNGRFYIMGDDASDILVLNDSLREETRIRLFAGSGSGRIPKDVKADVESAVVIDHHGKPAVLFLGSGSLSPQRDSVFLVDPSGKEIRRMDYSGFYNMLRAEFSQLNIEAAAVIDEELVLGIRANISHPDNFIVLASQDISQPEYKRKVRVKLPVAHIGISGMDYDQREDMLFITFSSEDTSNAYDDGAIGDSYLAIIRGARQQLKQEELLIAHLTKLADLDGAFRQQKIEAVSVVPGKNTLVLIADDDKGTTRLFRISY